MKKEKQYIIAIDGGGTKTDAVLVDENGKYLNQIKTEPSNPHKIGTQKAIARLSQTIKILMRNYSFPELGFIYIALAGGLERDKNKAKIIRKGLLKEIPELSFLKNKIEIQGDQLAGFRSGTNEKTGIVVIAGTGSIVMGWKKGQEVVVGGWDYILGDQGSGFWLGQKAFQAVCRDLDKRGPETQLTNMILKKLGVKKESNLMEKIYQKDIVKTIASLSSLIDKAVTKKDKIAKEISILAGQELALAVKTAIRELNLSKIKFPIVIIGGVFNSKIIFNTFKKQIKKIAPQASIVRPKSTPITGAVNIALELFRHLE